MDGDRAKKGLPSWRAKRRSIRGSSALWTRMLTPCGPGLAYDVDWPDSV